MSSARCTSCHCYTRNCPPGMPNHKHSTAGPSCTMNSEGRHFRVQSDTDNPVCDYDNRGSSCDFFSTAQEGSSLPYPSDISLGQPASEASSENSNMSTILHLLQQQKQDNDRKFCLIQEQISALSVTTACASPTATTITTTVVSTAAPSVTTSSSLRPISAPQVIPSEATSLASQLQGSLCQNPDPNYQGLTMD